MTAGWLIPAVGNDKMRDTLCYEIIRFCGIGSDVRTCGRTIRRSNRSQCGRIRYADAGYPGTVCA